MMRVGILGASGFTGVELLRLCAAHPDFDVVLATADSYSGTRAADLYPNLVTAYPDLVFSPLEVESIDVDLLLIALPHGTSGRLMPDLRGRAKKIVDLGADFRLRDAALYPTWYGEQHPNPELLGAFGFGIPELFRDEINRSDLVAAAGCYVTAAALALAPFVRQSAIATTGIVVDAASGVSGAGRDKFPFCGVDEDFAAYGLLTHRHTPEIEQAIGAQVIFTPHLAPMNRGILATCYARPIDPTFTTADALGALRDFYVDEPFVSVLDEPVGTKATFGSNCAHLTARVDPRTGWLVVIGALDNLVKGASGQMIQCANAMFGLPESTGLPIVGVYP